MATAATSEAIPKDGNVLQLLRTHGWGTGFYNPFADEENKALEQKLDQLQRKNQLLRSHTESTNHHLNDLRLHETNLHVDITLAHEMENARQAHLDHERILYAQSKKDQAFTLREHGRLNNQVQELRERNRNRLLGFEKRQKDLNASMQSIEQDQKLAQFLKAKEFDMEDELSQISKFKAMDKGEMQRIHKELLTYEKLNRDLRLSLESNLQNTSKASDQYRRLCLEFRHAHRKRKEMLLLWTNTLTAVRARDNDLQEMAGEYYELRERVKTEIGTHDCLTAFLQQRAEEMEEVEYRSKYYDVEIRNTNDRLEKLRVLILALKTDHLHTVSATQKLTARNQDIRQRIRTIREEFNTGFEKESNLKDEVQRLHEERDYIGNIAQDQDKLLRELESMNTSEEALLNKLEKRGVLIRKYHFEKTNEKVDLEEKIRTVSTRIMLINRIFTRLNASEYENTSDMAKRQSRLYRADLEVSTLEIKISRIMNSTIEPQYFNLQVRGDRLRAKNQYIMATNTFVTREADGIAASLQSLVDDIEVQRDRANQLDSTLDEARLTLAEVNRLAQGLSQDAKEHKFKYNLMKISVSRLKNSVFSFNGKIFSLSQMRSLFHTAGLERRSEIDFHVALSKKKTSVLKKEISFLETSAYRTDGFISKLRVKFELLSGSKIDEKKNDSGDILFNEMRAIFRERASLKKQRLQWEEQVDQDLNEIEGLKNVTEILRGSNEAYKLSLMPASQSGGDIQIKELESLEKRVFVYRNRCKRHIEKLEEAQRQLKKEIGVAKADIHKATTEADEKLLDISTIKDEAQYLRERIGRWNQLISRISTDEDSWREQGLLYFVELELNQKLLEEKYEHAMRKMLALMKRDPHIRKTIYLFLRQHDMVGQFMERLRITERKLFEQYCELQGENTSHAACTSGKHDDEFLGEDNLFLQSSIIPSNRVTYGEETSGII